MVNIVRVIDNLVKEDPKYEKIAEKRENGTDYTAFKFGENTIFYLMGMTFECARCGNCCYNMFDETPCKELKDNLCKIHADKSLLCRLFPYSISTTSRLDEDGKENIIWRYEGSKTTTEDLEKLEIGIWPAFYIQISSNCKGWMAGEKTLKELGLEAAHEIINFEGPSLLPPWMEKEQAAPFEKEARRNLERLQESFKEVAESNDIRSIFGESF